MKKKDEIKQICHFLGSKIELSDEFLKEHKILFSDDSILIGFQEIHNFRTRVIGVSKHKNLLIDLANEKFNQ